MPEKYQLSQVSVRLMLAESDPLYSAEAVDTPEKAAKLMAKTLAQMDREYCCVLNMDNASHPLNFNIVSIGDVNQSLVPMQNIFKSAILANAAGIIMFHNHPSGSTEPSANDISVTARLVDAGRLMNIPVMDHIIVAGGTGEIYSFRTHNPSMFAGQNLALKEDAAPWGHGSMRDADAQPSGKDGDGLPQMEGTEPQTSDKPEPQLAGKPELQTSDKPEPQLAGKPEQQTGGKPASQKAGWELPVELAIALDDFAKKVDPVTYEDTVVDVEENIRMLTAHIEQGTTGHIEDFLKGIMEEPDGIPEEQAEAKDLLRRVAACKPLARMEEQEEAEGLHQRMAAYTALAKGAAHMAENPHTDQEGQLPGKPQINEKVHLSANPRTKEKAQLQGDPQANVEAQPTEDPLAKAGKQPAENPLAKVEEQLEENANQIDGVLSNIPPVPEEKKAGKQPGHTALEHRQKPHGRVSFKAKLAEKKALIAKADGASQEKEKKPPHREM